MRNGAIDVYKFVFAWVICFYHFGEEVSPNAYFPMGNVVVELFVLMSGVFFFSGWERRKEKRFSTEDRCPPPEDAYAFLKKRFFRFFPYTTTAFLFAAAVRAYPYAVNGTLFEGHRLLEWFSWDVWEILLIRINGMKEFGFLNVPVWTVSAILIVEFVVFVILLHWEDVFATLICPCAIVVGLGVWGQLESTNYRAWVGFTTFGILRVFIMICFSFYCQKLGNRLKGQKLTTAGQWLLSAVEWGLYGFSVYLMINFNNRPFRWLTILIFFFAVAITISGKAYSNKIFTHSKFTDYLGKLSFGIYLTHFPIKRLFTTIWPKPYDMLDHKLLYASVVLIVAGSFLVFVKYICKVFCLFGGWAKARLIQAG